MEEIPEDIRETANAVYNAVIAAFGNFSPGAGKMAIADALLAERERGDPAVEAAYFNAECAASERSD